MSNQIFYDSIFNKQSNILLSCIATASDHTCMHVCGKHHPTAGDGTSGRENSDDDDDDGLSRGAVAGIVIGIIVGLILVTFLVVVALYFVIKRSGIIEHTKLLE